MVKLALRLIDLRLDLPILRMLGGGDVGIAGELRELNLRLLLQGLQFALIGREGVAGLVVRRLCDAFAAHQGGVSVIGGLVERDLGLLDIDVAQHPFVVFLHGFDRQ